MYLLLSMVLIISLVALFFLSRQQSFTERQLNRRFKGYNVDKDYLDDVKLSTKKRFEEEESQQLYKNKIRKDYLG